MEIKIFSGTNNPELAEKISKTVGIPLSPIKIKRFKDNEIYVRLLEKVRGDDVYVVQTLAPNVNDELMELLIMIDAIRRASARRINVIVPYLCYARQDRKAKSREPITAKLISNLITASGADRILTYDLHSDQIQGYFDIPLDHFVAFPIFADYFMKKGISNISAVAPDTGAVKKTRRFAKIMKCPMVIVDKRRVEHNKSDVLNIIGNVKARNVVIIDDMIDTGGTITNAADALKKKGADRVYICATHALLSGDAANRLDNCSAEEVILTDSICIPDEKLIDKIKILSISDTIGNAIKRINSDRSLGEMFDWED